MHTQSKVRIDRIPRCLIATAWPAAEVWLAKGATIAELSLGGIMARLYFGQAELWLISDVAKHEAVGALVTSTHASDGHAYLLMYALGGRNVWTWAKALHSAIYKHAVAAGFDAVRFYGRHTWARFFPDCKIIGARDGHELFERALP